MSHTVSVKIRMKAGPALGNAVTTRGGAVLGEGTHQLYASKEIGWGFSLPGWKFPLVLQGDGTLAYDDYGGAWGDVQDITRLQGRYALEQAREAASQQGWISEMEGESLRIYHPDGGILLVSADGTVDAHEFSGSGCAVAAGTIADAIGSSALAVAKPAYYEEIAKVEVNNG